MKMKDVHAGMPVTVNGKDAVVAAMLLNGCFVKFEDGTTYTTYDKLKVKEK